MESQPQNPEFRNNPKNFHPCRSGPTLFYTLMVFLQLFFDKVNLEKINRWQKNMKYYTACKELNEQNFLDLEK